jgi:signal transduction histidine kinase
MSDSAPLDLPADVAQPTGFLHTLLTMSLTAVAVLRPLYAEAGETIRDFAWVSLNPAGQRMLAQPACPTESLLTLFPNARLEGGDFALFCQAFATGELMRNQTNYQADGVDGYFLTVAQRYENVLLVNFSDTNEQSRSAVEEALRASQAVEQAAHAIAEQQRQRFREVLTQMPAYIAVYQGPDHIYQFVNPAYQSLFPHRSFLGRPFREGTPESVELGVVALFDQVYQTGEPVYLREMEGWFDFHSTGQPVQVFLNISLHPLRDVQGRIDGVMDFTYDVSEQVRARQQVEQLNQELESRVQVRTQELHDTNAHLRRTNADLDTFVYTASHDLKSPITNIEGLLLALHEVLPAEAQQAEGVAEVLRLLQDTVGRFHFTITQLTDLVRLQQSQTGPTEPVALAPLLEAVRYDLATEIRAAGATVHVQVPPDLLVTFSPANLRSIVYNLLSNAVKYRTPDRPAQVWVRAAQREGAVVVAVQDNGLGLDQSQQGRLFQVFQRLHTHVDGSGIGLYMIKRLIENGGATITVSSEPRVGTTFTVTFRA